MLLRQYPVVTVTGPRQSGKTTLCQACLPNLPYVNLDAPDERAFAQDDPRGFLRRFPQGAILDEIQHVPALLSYIQVRVDEIGRLGQFLLSSRSLGCPKNDLAHSGAARTSFPSRGHS